MKSAYDLEIQPRIAATNDNDLLKSFWQNLWKSGLHNRHKKRLGELLLLLYPLVNG